MGIEASYRRITLQEFERLQNDVTYASVYFGDDLETGSLYNLVYARS